MGSWGETVPFGIFPHLDWTAAFSIRYGNLYYNPFHMLSIVFLYGATVLFAMHGATILATSRLGGEREIEQITDRGTGAERSSCSGAGRWGGTRRWKHAPLELVVRVAHHVHRRRSASCSPARSVDNWYLWGGEARRRARVPGDDRAHAGQAERSAWPLQGAPPDTFPGINTHRGADAGALQAPWPAVAWPPRAGLASRRRRPRRRRVPADTTAHDPAGSELPPPTRLSHRRRRDAPAAPARPATDAGGARP